MKKLKSHKVFLVSTVEPIPIIDGDIEAWRTHNIALDLRDCKKEVYFFISSFNHYTKEFRDKKLISAYESKYSIRLKYIPSISYKKNISIRRICNYFIQTLYLLFYFIIFSKKKDSLLLTVPAIEHLISIMTFRGRASIDYRDLWPDIFIGEYGLIKTQLVKLYFNFCNYCLASGFRKSEFVITISDGFKEHLINKFKLASKKIIVLTQTRQSKLSTIELHSNKVISKLNATYIYAGKISERTQVIKFIRSLILLDNFQGKILICGSGEENDIKLLLELIAKYDCVEYLGYLSRLELKKIYMQSDYGLLPYPNNIDFEKALPNKFFEYLSVNLPIAHGGLNSIEINENIQFSKLAFNIFKEEPKEPTITPLELLSLFNKQHLSSKQKIIEII